MPATQWFRFILHWVFFWKCFVSRIHQFRIEWYIDSEHFNRGLFLEYIPFGSAKHPFISYFVLKILFKYIKTYTRTFDFHFKFEILILSEYNCQKKRDKKMKENTHAHARDGTHLEYPESNLIWNVTNCSKFYCAYIVYKIVNKQNFVAVITFVLIKMKIFRENGIKKIRIHHFCIVRKNTMIMNRDQFLHTEWLFCLEENAWSEICRFAYNHFWKYQTLNCSYWIIFALTKEILNLP